MPRFAAHAAALLLATLLGAASTAAAAAQEPTALVETQRVTAFDLLVELARPDKPGKAVEPPRGLTAADFTLLWDGARLPLVGVAAGAADREPWRLVIYVDRALSSSHTVRWATMELAERVERLTGLGEVEIVVAEPEPRRLLAPTRDPELIDDSLSGIFLAPAGASELVSRREGFLIAAADAAASPAAAHAESAARAERLLVARQIDRLLGWLTESVPPTSRRAVLLVGDGWDLEPERFYGGAAGTASATPGEPVPPLGDSSLRLAETLAAYGWVAAPLAPPAPRVGSGRFGAYAVKAVDFPLLFAIKLRSLEVWLDGNRAPKKARALTELGNTLREQGRLDEAVEAYRKAVYHYYDHPKTAARQAAVLVALGETLRLQGDERGARVALRAATVFDPSLEQRFPFTAAVLTAPDEPLARLAELTAGRVVRAPDDLDGLLTSLAHRLRLTAQLAGVADGALHRLDLRLRRPGLRARFPPVARWGDPPAILQLRLRRLLQDRLTDGDLSLDLLAVSRRPAPAGALEIDLRLEPESAAAAGSPGDLLVSWASSGIGPEITYHLRAATIPLAGAAGAGARLTIARPAGHLWLALLVEAPASGSWGGIGLDLADD